MAFALNTRLAVEQAFRLRHPGVERSAMNASIRMLEGLPGPPEVSDDHRRRDAECDEGILLDMDTIALLP